MVSREIATFMVYSPLDNDLFFHAIKRLIPANADVQSAGFRLQDTRSG
jgi:hypothetical protein